MSVPNSAPLDASASASSSPIHASMPGGAASSRQSIQSHHCQGLSRSHVATRRSSTPFWALMRAETLKLRRSLVWIFAFLLPLLAVITGSVNYRGNREVLTEGWDSYASQVGIFYSLFFFSVGVALICAASWRPENRGTSWNAMATLPASPSSVVLAKTLVCVLPVAVMEIALVVLTWASGFVVLRLDGAPPMEMVVSGAVGVVASLPLVAFQSLLSMKLRSFGGPVGLGLVATFVGLGISAKLPALAGLWPHSLVTRALVLGSTAVSDAGGLDWQGIAPILGWTGASALLWWSLAALLARRG